MFSWCRAGPAPSWTRTEPAGLSTAPDLSTGQFESPGRASSTTAVAITVASMGSNEDRDRTRSRLDALTGGRDDCSAGDGDVEAKTPDWLDEPRTVSEGRGWVPSRWRAARISPGRRGAVTLAAVGAVAVLIAGAMVLRDSPEAHPVPPLPAVQAAAHASPSASATPASVPVAAPPDAELVVSVVGLVHVNGLVRLAPGARIADAIAAAGGALDGADLLSLNMAQRLSDGDQILVGVAAPGGGPPVLGSAAVSTGTAPGSPTGGGGGKVNLNKATEAELDALPGVGPVTAKAIVGWRAANGSFTDVEQLGEVDGIGPGRLAKLRDLVVL